MQNLEEVCIVFSAENYAEAMCFKEFMKWTGISYFLYVHNEIDEKLNKDLMEHDNYFDVVFYINSEGKKWCECLKCLSENRVDVPGGEIWDGNKCTEIHLNLSLCAAWELLEPDNIIVREVFKELVSIYCQYDILRNLVNDTNSLYMMIDVSLNTAKNYLEQKKLLQREYEVRYEQWKNIVGKLEELQKKYENIEEYCGMEYVLHALTYSKWKTNELCGRLNWKPFIETGTLLQQIDEIYKYNNRFYMAENLKSKIAGNALEYSALAIPYIKKCTQACRVNACNSFYYYRWGKEHEQAGRRALAIKIYEASYEKNRLNFRSLFKLAVDRIIQKDRKQAEKYLVELLNVLQVTINLDEEKLKLLPPMELQYASKCFILLGELAEDEPGNNSASLYYTKVMEIWQSIGKNEFLKKMYPDETEQRNVRMCLSTHLTKEAIKEKISRMNKS